MTFASMRSSPTFFRSAMADRLGGNARGGGARARRGPGTELRDGLRARLRKRDSAAKRGLDLRAGESIARRGEALQVVLRRVALLLAEVDAEDDLTLRGIRQVDEEDLVEAALAKQFGREVLDVVRGRDDEHRLLLLLEP